MIVARAGRGDRLRRSHGLHLQDLRLPSGGRAPGASRPPIPARPRSSRRAGRQGVPPTDKKLLNRLGEDATRLGDDGAPTTDPAAQLDGLRRAGLRAQGAHHSHLARRRCRPRPRRRPPPGAPGPQPLVAIPGVTVATLARPRPLPGAACRPRPAQPPRRQRRAAAPRQVAAAATAAPPCSRTRAGTGALGPAAGKPRPAQNTGHDVPAAARPGGDRYVAVLSSQKTRMDALKAFADLQQKYGDVLASKTPDVQEANLGDKGAYRAVVGPPGWRNAAAASAPSSRPPATSAAG